MTSNPDTHCLEFLELWIESAHRDGRWMERTLGVGGYFRDRLLGRESYDLDLVVESSGGAERFCRMLHAEFPDSLSSPHQLGKSYPIWQIDFKAPVSFSGKNFEVQGASLQVADTQKESFLDSQSRQRVSLFGSLEEDCARRDFTVNMIFWDLVKKAYVDPSGVAQTDLQSKILRTHPKVDPRQILSDDPLRIMRLFRFQAQLGFLIEEKTMRAAIESLPRLSILSRERLRDEWNKCARSCGLAPLIRGLDQANLLKEFLPEILPMKGCEQDKIYHAEGDVFVHTLMVLDRAPHTVEDQWAALIHDLGKPYTRTVQGERTKFLGHEVVSEERGKVLLERLAFSKQEIEAILVPVRYHLRGGDVENWRTLKPARKLLRDLGEHRERWWNLVVADSNSSLGTNGVPRTEHLRKLEDSLRQAAQIPLVRRPAVTGADVMEFFDLKPGKEVGDLLELAAEIEEDFLLQNKSYTAKDVLAELARQKVRHQ